MEKFNELVLSAIELQKEVNTRLGGEDWMTSGNHYSAAVVGELIELAVTGVGAPGNESLVTHNNDLIEFADVLSFAISHCLVKGLDVENLLGRLKVSEHKPYDSFQLCNAALTNWTQGKYEEFFDTLGILLDVLNYHSNSALVLFHAKHDLNIFRSEYGYGEGNYNKIWDAQGNEDNYYLSNIVINTVWESNGSLDEMRKDILSQMSKQYELSMPGLIVAHKAKLQMPLPVWLETYNFVHGVCEKVVGYPWWKKVPEMSTAEVNYMVQRFCRRTVPMFQSKVEAEKACRRIATSMGLHDEFMEVVEKAIK